MSEAKMTPTRQPVYLLAGVLLFVFIAVLIWDIRSTSLLERESLRQDGLTSWVRSEVGIAISKETKQLKDRLRFLEEDARFKRQPVLPTRNRYNHSRYPTVKALNELQRKRILVTGGSGFVGSHLVDQLMKDGHEVTVVDNFFTGRKKNVERWLGHENFELINHDVVEPLMIEVDQIYHLASPASPVKYMYNPIKTIKTNTLGTLNMLGLAKRVKARILFASTSEVYGDPAEHPQTEEYWGNVNTIGPRACYDEGKRVAETMMYAYKKQENVDVRVARIFNTYGPRMHMYDGRVVSNFIIQALKGDPITVFSPGNQTRSFMYITDLVRGLILLMNSNFSKPVNLGNPDEHTILEFARIVTKATGGKLNMKFLPAQRDDPHRRRPAIARAKKVLNWEPTVPLDAGISHTIKYFKNELAMSTHHRYS